MLRGLFTFLSVSGLLVPVEITAQNLIATSQLQATLSEQPCPSDQWCVVLRVVDASTALPLEAALLEIDRCGGIMTDTTGRARASCADAGTVGLTVRRIGFQSATGSLPAELGHSYSVTATLAPVDVPPIVDYFNLPPCAEGDEDARTRCLTYELEVLRQSLLALLDSARARAPSPAMVDSAQAAWERFLRAHCTAEASLAPTSGAARIASLDCQLTLTRDRAYQLATPIWRRRP